MSAVRRALVEGEGGVRRATLEIALGDGAAPGAETALVSLVQREGRVIAVCSCGAGPSCAHSVLGLRWLEDGADGVVREPGPAGPEGTVMPTPATSATEPSAAPRSPAATTDPGRTAAPVQRSQALAAAVDDLVTAIVRAGVTTAAGAPSLDESLRRLVAAAPAPLPTSIARVFGRLREALVAHDVEVAARLCTGLGQLADALRDGDAATVTAWLGVVGAAALEGRTALATMLRSVEPAGETRLIEVAREWVSTVDRAGLERRYLADPLSGVVYREERLRGAAAPSLGPCPRTLAVALAELESGPAPRRLRLLQYEVSLAPGPLAYTELATHAAVTFAPLLDLFREEVRAYPALAEPFVMVAPSAIERTRGGADLIDEDGGRLALVGVPPAGAAALLAFAQDTIPSFVAGRLLTSQGALALAPLSVVIGSHDAPSLRRLT